jgi:hypothetical protein
MSLGTSTFLSAILLSLVVIFISTKDRWKWKRIVVLSVAGFVALFLLASGGYLLYTALSNRPRAENAFWGIPISASKSDVKFIKGEPSDKTTDGEWETWEYTSQFTNDVALKYGIAFKGARLHSVWVSPSRPLGIVDAAVWLSDKGIQQVGYGDSYESIVHKFGTPSNVSQSKNDLARIASFKKYRVFFLLEKNHVSVYGIYNPAVGPVLFSEEQPPKEKK